MRNTMIDDATLNDLQICGFPEMTITDEVLMDIEKARGKRKYVAVRKEEEKAES